MLAIDHAITQVFQRVLGGTTELQKTGLGIFFLVSARGHHDPIRRQRNPVPSLHPNGSRSPP